MAWLDLHGVHPYFLLDEGEINDFRRRFESQNRLGSLNVARVWEYHGSPNVFLFDPLQYERPGDKIAIFTPPDAKMPYCAEPTSPPTLVFKD